MGRGIADITGEAAGCGMLGYGKADQTTAGIHLRLRARAFVLATAGDLATADDVPERSSSRLLLIVAELPLVFDSVRREVLRRLGVAFGDRYTELNTVITCTHTHCGPGGYSHHALYNLTTGGFHHKTFGAIVDGIVEAATHADADVAPARLTLAFGELRDASANRSQTSFELNPSEERAHFPDAIDPQTTLLSILRDGRPVAALNFFATHGTSMTNRNRLISSDNKGYAAYAWERLGHGVDYLADGQPDFIAAFAQTNAGDMSPNLNHRPGSGPTENEFDNTRIIGSRQKAAAAALLGAGERVEAVLDARLTYIDLSCFEVSTQFAGDGRTHTTSGPYAGAAQIAGTDEGKGFAGFRQGRNPLFDALSASVAYRLFPELRDSQAPKGLVLPRAANRAVPLIQERVPVQLLRIGQLYLIALPAEVTIVAGLRLRRAVASVVGADLNHVLVLGYSNGYIHYVTTPEEYDGQRYEAASTMYGRWELPALVQTAAGLATAMRDGAPVGRGTPPPDLSGRLRPSRRDLADEAHGGGYGTVLRAPRGRYRTGDTVSARFVGASPNNDLHRGSTFVLVQRREGLEWITVADDGDFSTRFHWARTGSGTIGGGVSDGGASGIDRLGSLVRRAFRRRSAGSVVTVEWSIPVDAVPGAHRMRYFGDALGADGDLTPISGETDSFEVAAG